MGERELFGELLIRILDDALPEAETEDRRDTLLLVDYDFEWFEKICTFAGIDDALSAKAEVKRRLNLPRCARARDYRDGEFVFGGQDV
jgi:hypothetical protein